ncbi:baseplate J-like protein [Paenibacillus sp. 32O-W]|uniref:baseplate J/gp47 family protein n=1 Tax=Paenibacillus sp. 32O-W TaxID=1695218 RepID=UPI0007206526|nr:baseplate J/gp47 family protein [Paenibacillus sp. 32O-W]ALS27203.1 baseplate J-like protein [Paenibacillus sp. 32O-W]
MLDANGFRRPQYADLVSDMEADARARYGDDVNTSERSVLGILLRLFAWFLSKVWQSMENTYYSSYVNTAEGVQLDRLGPYVGITRKLETWATGTIQLTGTPDHTEPGGFRVETPAGVVFETIEDIVLDGNGVGSGEIRALEPGTIGNVAANTITVISNPNANIMSVTNPQPTSGGQNKETDQEFRERFVLSVSGGGAATIDSIRSALLRTPGVRAAVVIENNTMSTDAAGRPPKSFEAYVLGGAPAEIGQTILDTKAAGIESYGTESVVINDISGNPHTIRFSYAEEVQVHVRVTVRTNNQYPADGDVQVESAIIRYVGGEDYDGQLYVGLNMGDDVIHSRIIAAVYKVNGIEDATVELSTDGTTWTQANVSIDQQEVAQTSHAIIEVVHA